MFELSLFLYVVMIYANDDNSSSSLQFSLLLPHCQQAIK